MKVLRKRAVWLISKSTIYYRTRRSIKRLRHMTWWAWSLMSMFSDEHTLWWQVSLTSTPSVWHALWWAHSMDEHALWWAHILMSKLSDKHTLWWACSLSYPEHQTERSHGIPVDKEGSLDNDSPQGQSWLCPPPQWSTTTHPTFSLGICICPGAVPRQ